MLRLDRLEDAVSKAEFLKEFCFGVRIVRLEDEKVLHSTLLQPEEQSTVEHDLKRTEHKPADVQGNARRYYIGSNMEIYESTSVPVMIADQPCALEMIQPRSRVISAVSGGAGGPFSAEKYMQDALGELAFRDTLTGLHNRRYIDEYLPAALSEAYAREQPLSLIFADIDRFKLVNDNNGHLFGDLVLQHVAQLMQKKIRKTDSWVARYGGDEFIICLPGVGEAEAQRIANRLRVAIMSERFPMENGVLQLTCSFGVQSLEKSDFQLTALMLLRQADEKMYQAKNAGRNKVI